MFPRRNFENYLKTRINCVNSNLDNIIYMIKHSHKIQQVIGGLLYLTLSEIVQLISKSQARLSYSQTMAVSINSRQVITPIINLVISPAFLQSTFNFPLYIITIPFAVSRSKQHSTSLFSLFKQRLW